MKSLREELKKTIDVLLPELIKEEKNSDDYKLGFQQGWKSCIDYILESILRSFR